MRSVSTTEQEMRSETAPTLETTEELGEYITSLTERQHDYDTCIYALSLAATAAFNHVAHKLGVTGFQASCANLDIVRRTRGIDGPFILLRGSDMLYPQCDLLDKLREAVAKWADWASDEAEKNLANNKREDVHPDVWAHWEKLAARRYSAEKPE
jgi:hypothetical protein